MTEMTQAFDQWVSTGQARHGRFGGYVNAIAQARYIIRKVLRIADDQAKSRGLDPLAHQALIQIFAAQAPFPISHVAERLDIAPAFASRLVRELETKGLARRAQSPNDRRVTFVTATDEGVAMLREIDNAVHVHVDYFQKQIDDDARLAALAMFAFYVGLEADSPLGAEIRRSIRPPTGSAAKQPATTNGTTPRRRGAARK